MSKPPHNAQAPASKDLVERLKAAANDVVLLRGIIESNDVASVAAAFAALLTGGSASAPTGSALRKKAHNRPCPSLPAETFFEVVLFADRDTLDSMQLVCHFLLDFIRERELMQLALRGIPEVQIGKYLGRYEGGCWLPIVKTVCDRGTGKELVPKSIHHLTSCLRTAFCESVRIIVVGAEEGPEYSDFCDMIFHDLVAPNTFVGTLTITNFVLSLAVVARGIKAFKSTKTVSVELYDDINLEPLVEPFFVCAAEHGVRHIVFQTASGHGVLANTASALSFAFAEPKTGGDRSLLGITYAIGPDFLAQIKQKAADLDEVRHVDFRFKLAHVASQIDSTGFEKYQKDEEGTWLMNDLENRVNVEVKQTEALVEIHVFSSV